jgi:PilZ domain
MDKREAARVPVRVPALCRSQGVVIDGLVEDVSRTGLFLRAPKLMATGSSAEIELEMPGEPPLYLNAEVVRVEHSSKRAGMGLRIIVDAQESRQLANFIMRQHATLR